MLRFYVRLAEILEHFQKLIALVGIAAIGVMVVLVFTRADEAGRSMVLLSFCIGLLSLLLISATRFFLDLRITVGDTRGFFKRLAIRLRLAVAWLFSLIISLVILKIILLIVSAMKRI